MHPTTDDRRKKKKKDEEYQEHFTVALFVEWGCENHQMLRMAEERWRRKKTNILF